NGIPAILRDLVARKWIADRGVANLASRSGVINLPENDRTAESIGSYHRTRLVVTGEGRIQHSREITLLERGGRKLAETAKAQPVVVILLVIHEEKRLVSSVVYFGDVDRTANRKAFIVLPA